MFFLELVGVWIGASVLLFGFLAFCDYRTQREYRRRNIMRQVNG